MHVSTITLRQVLVSSFFPCFFSWILIVFPLVLCPENNHSIISLFFSQSVLFYSYKLITLSIYFAAGALIAKVWGWRKCGEPAWQDPPWRVPFPRHCGADRGGGTRPAPGPGNIFRGRAHTTTEGCVFQGKGREKPEVEWMVCAPVGGLAIGFLLLLLLLFCFILLQFDFVCWFCTFALLFLFVYFDLYILYVHFYFIIFYIIFFIYSFVYVFFLFIYLLLFGQMGA